MTKSTLAKARRKLSHSQITGKFEPTSPFSDPALLRYVTDSVQAMETLSPVFLAFAHGSGIDSPAGRLMLRGLGALLFLRESVIRTLDVDDKRTNGESAEGDIQRLVSNFQDQWCKVLQGLPPLAAIPSDDSDKGVP